jgi:transcriptional regulator with XRE-family HTH domain
MGKRASSDGDTSPDPVDIQIGTLIRECRGERGMSQGALGTVLDLTFQQVQKYERGINRLSASRLRQLCLFFNKPARFFLPDTPPETLVHWQPTTEANLNVPILAVAEEQAELIDEALSSEEQVELMRNFSRITDAGSRSLVLELARKLAGPRDPTET